VHERYRQTTDRQTDGRAIAYSEREREFTFANKTIGRYGEVVEKPLYKCIREGLMHVAAWHHGTPKD